jgi:Mannosyltransferase (PIG-V)
VSHGEVPLRGQDELETSAVEFRVAPPLRRPAVTGRAPARLAGWLRAARWPAAVYLGSRLLILVLAWADMLITHRSLGAELSLFDGQWYLKLAAHGYPAQATAGKSTLGFLPLYPLAIRGLAALGPSLLAAALILAFTGGLVAAVLLQRLARIWWGEATARWAVLMFCLFPGAVVFSMAYSECLTLPLVLGCLLALRSGRWLTAGLAAGLASAVEPAALMLVPACLLVSIREVRAFGMRDRLARRSLLAPLLAPAGLGAFAVYLWYRTGTPFASFQAQHDGWHQGDPITLLRQPVAERMLDNPETVLGHLANPSLWNGLLGTVFLICALVALARFRHELSPGVLVWTCGVGVLTLWSVMSLTNARMLLIAFPAVIVWARRFDGRRRALFLAAEIALFVLASMLTLAGLMLP